MNIFQKIQIRKPKLNKFDLSHERKMSAKMGKLIPIMLQDVIPGDKFRVNSEILMRLAPMLAPVMHRVNVYTHYFFVPNRLIWDEWETFITGGEDGLQAPISPYFVTDFETSAPLMQKGSLSDYFGLPVGPTTEMEHAAGMFLSALPFRAYQLIYNEYYRDQNLTDKIAFSRASGAVTDLDLILPIRNRCWEKDYFTSALPWAQRGGAVGVPLSADEQPTFYETDGDPYTPVSAANLQVSSAGKLTSAAGPTQLLMDSGNTITVNDLRTAVRLQEWLEKNARGGSRYIEQILSHFGVISSDSRLQRPEYLGGGVQPVVISETLSTVGTTDVGIEAPQGNMAGHGISVGRTNSFKKSFEEHGFVIGIMSVLPKTAYQQGVERLWQRANKTEYFWPEFANLGEQEIKKGELYHDFGAAAYADNWATWGYQSRYAEYRYKCSSVHGDFRDDFSFWHMGRIFTASPSLNENFVISDPTKRIFAVEDPDVDDLYVQIYNDVSALRPMPYYASPTL